MNTLFLGFLIFLEFFFFGLLFYERRCAYSFGNTLPTTLLLPEFTGTERVANRIWHTYTRPPPPGNGAHYYTTAALLD